jgi:transposase-like protein
MRRRYTDDERRELVELVKSGRATTREAAARLGVTASTAYWWMKRAHGEPTFVRLVRASEAEAAIAVRVGRAEIEVRRGFDVELLRAVVEALGGGAA